MNSIQVGPFAFPISALLLIGALLIASVVARLADRSRSAEIEPLLWRILLVGLLAARAAYVLAYFDSYAASAWQVVDIRDGGFMASVGFMAAAAMTAWLGWRKRDHRKPLLLATLAGAVVWAAGTLAVTWADTEPVTMPKLSLTRIDGGSVDLHSLIGKPVVLNLWASWCPPCRREMPVLRDAQARNQDVVFVFVNQGESELAIREYLTGQGLVLGNVLLDPGATVGRQTGFRALPTTLFFDRHGSLIDHRTGELSSATLTQRLNALRERQ
ncbi:TlpA disulfide reductase family protein [Lacisediminimonas sp.]|uniref:TlpA disulfide reductase family protein n=1 Tax=Lacisediminimonas sp. TaxID=3060582 RepID=UPI00271CCF5B|nr:TlpA disulfide reductase family protein [Lacisediminimonas sp.]MDO8300356.1 TlpA disulfide reductase family protein [Lacisediminimonas sp.]